MRNCSSQNAVGIVRNRKSAIVVSNKHVYRIMSIANVLDKLRVFEDAAEAVRYLEANGALSDA